MTPAIMADAYFFPLRFGMALWGASLTKGEKHPESETLWFRGEKIFKGMTVCRERTVTEKMIKDFAEVSGDDNPVHLDEEFALTTRFKGRISHGMLTASELSTLFGKRFRGSIYVEQTLKFTAPVRIGDVVFTEAKVIGIDPIKRQVRFECRCSVENKTVIEGKAVLFLPKPKEESARGTVSRTS